MNTSSVPAQDSTLELPIEITDSAESQQYAISELPTAEQEGEEVEVQGAANSPAPQAGPPTQQQLAPETSMSGVNSSHNPSLPLCSTGLSVGMLG